MKIDIDKGGILSTGMFLVFLVLKLCHVIQWSWWWVTAPIWIPLLIIISIILLFLVGLLIFGGERF